MVSYASGANAKKLIKVESRRAQELFCYLLLNRERVHEREKVATLMWTEQSTSRSRQYLRQMLWRVKSALQPLELGEDVLLAERDWIGVNPNAQIWVDASAFADAYAQVENIPGNTLMPEQVEQVQRALQLYQGDLLEGWYEDWCILERDRYQNMFLAMLDKLLNYCEATHEYGLGLAYGTEILRYDRASERTHRTLMRLHHKAGHRSAAIEQYNACVAALAKELDVGPAHSTIALYQQICADQLDPQEEILLAPSAQTTQQTPIISDALQEMQAIQTSISQLQQQFAALTATVSQNAQL